MSGTPRLLLVLSAVIVAAAPQAAGQVATRTRLGPAWTPMGALAPVSLSTGERIVLGTTTWSADKAQAYEVLEKLPATSWASWSLRKLNHTCMAYSPPRLCTTTWGPVLKTWAPAVQVRAMLDLVGGGPSEIYTYQEVGALAAPASASPGLVRAVLQPGQSLELLDHRVLYQTPLHGWGPPTSCSMWAASVARCSGSGRIR